MSQSKDEYPDFKDADVIIMSPTGKVWKLHHQTLSNGSQVFRDIFSRHAPLKLKTSEKQNGNLIQWRLHMIENQAAHEVDPNSSYYKTFMAVDISRKQNPISLGNWNGVGQEAKFNHIYDNLFKCLYNLPPDFTPVSDRDENASIKEALNLLTAASYLKAYAAVRLVIENHVMQFNQLLWYQVESKPETWASIACKLQSAIIFREAMIHLAGRYHLKGADGIRKNKLESVEFGNDIWDLAAQKGRELKDYKLQTERRLFDFMPARMLHEPKKTIGGVVAPGRQVYAGDVYWWMCLHLIRQYFSVAVLQNRHHRGHDGGIAFYRTIAAPHSYLLDDALNSFYEMCAMTPKSRVVFVHALNELKKDMVSVVQGLLVDHSQAIRGPDAVPRRYLTCTVVLDEELPWPENANIPVAPGNNTRITDEDEENRLDSIEINKAVSNSMELDVHPASSSDSGMFVRDQPGAPVAEPDATFRTSIANEGPSSSTYRSDPSSARVLRRRPSSNESSASPAKRVKTTTVSETTTGTAGTRMEATDAEVLTCAVHVGLVKGDELRKINARADAAVAAGIPNMGGLVSNPKVKPRGGLNTNLGRAVIYGYGAAPGASAMGADTTPGSDVVMGGVERGTEDRPVANTPIEGSTSRPAREALPNVAVTQTQTRPLRSHPAENNVFTLKPAATVRQGSSSQVTGDIPAETGWFALGCVDDSGYSVQEAAYSASRSPSSTNKCELEATSAQISRPQSRHTNGPVRTTLFQSLRELVTPAPRDPLAASGPRRSTSARVSYPQSRGANSAARRSVVQLASDVPVSPALAQPLRPQGRSGEILTTRGSEVQPTSRGPGHMNTRARSQSRGTHSTTHASGENSTVSTTKELGHASAAPKGSVLKM